MRRSRFWKARFDRSCSSAGFSLAFRCVGAHASFHQTPDGDSISLPPLLCACAYVISERAPVTGFCTDLSLSVTKNGILSPEPPARSSPSRTSHENAHSNPYMPLLICAVSPQIRQNRLRLNADVTINGRPPKTFREQSDIRARVIDIAAVNR